MVDEVLVSRFGRGFDLVLVLVFSEEKKCIEKEDAFRCKELSINRGLGMWKTYVFHGVTSVGNCAQISTIK